MSGPSRAIRTVVLGAAAAGLLVAGAAAASSGNRQSVRLYSRAQATVGRYQGVTFTGGGTSYKILHRPGYDDFAYFFGATPRGYHRASDRVLVVIRHGRVVEEVDTLSAKGLPSVRTWLDDTHGMVLGRVLDARGCAVFFSDDSASFVGINQRFGFADNPRFTAPRREGSSWLLQSSYPLAGGVAHEVDTLRSTRGGLLWSSSRLRLTGGFYSGDQLSAGDFGYRLRDAAPPLPQLGRC
jgi:hypothetical protein